MQKLPSPLLTPALHATLARFDELRVRGGVGLLLGDPGTGKTTLLTHYAYSRPPGPWAGPVLLYRTEAVNTPLAVVHSILRTVGVAWHGGTRDGMRVLEQELPAGTLLLVDDAGATASHSLDVLRCLHERTGVRLVLAGLPELAQHLRCKCPALAHRVHLRHTLAPFDTADVAALVRPHVRVANEAVSTTLAAESGGNPYWAGEGLRLARHTAQAQHVRLSPQLLTQVFDTWADGRGRRSA